MVDGTPEREPLLDSYWATVTPEVRAANLDWATTEGYVDTASNIMAVDAAIRANTTSSEMLELHNPYRGLPAGTLAQLLEHADEADSTVTSGQIKAILAEITDDFGHLGVTAQDIQQERADARRLGIPIPESDTDVALSIYKSRQ